MDKNNAHIITIDDLIKHIKEVADEEDHKYYIDSFIRESHAGYVFVQLTCNNEEGTPEYHIVEDFIDNHLLYIRGKSGELLDKYMALDFRRYV